MELKEKAKRSLCVFLIACCILVISCGNGSVESEYADIENRVFELVNEHRTSEGLATLGWSELIAEQCRIHSEDMAEGTVDFGHDGFNDRVENIRQEIDVVRAGENVAYNMGYIDPAQQAVDAWLLSSGHRQNIEGDYVLTGVGVAKSEGDAYYFTQIFIQ